MSCKVDSWILNGGDAWFRCPRGTLGCPISHDGRTPHCIYCVEQEGPCPYEHDPPGVERSWEEHQAMTEAA